MAVQFPDANHKGQEVGLIQTMTTLFQRGFEEGLIHQSLVLCQCFILCDVTLHGMERSQGTLR